MIENTVRALIFRGEKDEILIARNKNLGYSFLPGGSIKFGEKGNQALDRNVFERIGTEGRCGHQIWNVENIYRNPADQVCHELGFYFTYSFYQRFYDELVESLDDDREYLWVKTYNLELYNLKPDIINSLIKIFASGGNTMHFFSDSEHT